MSKMIDIYIKITFGNLEVTYKGAKKEGNSCLSWMYIANAYEVEEDWLWLWCSRIIELWRG
mgnify:CR=1 FL=1